MKLCKHHGRSSYFALKVMAINEILKLKQVEHVKNEKKILQVKNNFELIPVPPSKDYFRASNIPS